MRFSQFVALRVSSRGGCPYRDQVDLQIRHYVISGKVQGVGYRAFAHEEARMLKLKGWVRNIRDGRVELLAEGPDEVLEQFEEALYRGPSHALVESIKSEIVDGSFSWENFSIVSDGEVLWSEKH